MIERVLVTGGVGFIGSHTVVLLQEAGYDVIILDNLSNSSKSVLQGIRKITGILPQFVEGDVRDRAVLERIFAREGVDAVIHFAGLKAAGESVQEPLLYYDNNVHGSVQLLHAMDKAGVKIIIFSSSATVYGDPLELPLTESHPCSPVNPYGHSKLIIEGVLRDLSHSKSGWSIACLRYFNPVGAHPSGNIGESPLGIPNNLMPYITQVARGSLPYLKVFGNDYPTPDGTGVRDYIHVMDLANGHMAALKYCETHQSEILTVNLGTGTGYSVLEIVRAFEAATGRSIAHKIEGRRRGDVAACWANTQQAAEKLHWKAMLGIEDMCRDAWRWAANNSFS